MGIKIDAHIHNLVYMVTNANWRCQLCKTAFKSFMPTYYCTNCMFNVCGGCMKNLNDENKYPLLFIKGKKERSRPKNNSKKKYEKKFKTINAQNNQEIGLNNIKNKNSSEIGKKSGVNKFIKYFSSDIPKYQYDYKMNNDIDLTSLKNIINKMGNKLKKLPKIYFDKWYEESIKNENEEKNIDNDDKPKKGNNFKKQKKQIKAIVTPFGEQNKIYENENNTNLQRSEIKPYISKRNKRLKNMTYGEENIFFNPKEEITPFGTEPNLINNKPLQKSQDLNLKVKKKKKYIKKQESNLAIITPMDDTTNDLKESKINSKSNDNLTYFDEPVPIKLKNNNKTVDNSFVNKYFKTRAINYSKEDINPDVMDIQIKQEKDTESEKIENMTKTIKIGLHLLRKVIRSFQKRKTKGSPKDILKIYFNKWRRINTSMPPILNTEIYTFDKEKEEIYNTNIKTEPIYNNNYKKTYYNINLVKKIKNFNFKHLINLFTPSVISLKFLNFLTS